MTWNKQKSHCSLKTENMELWVNVFIYYNLQKNLSWYNCFFKPYHYQGQNLITTRQFTKNTCKQQNMLNISLRRFPSHVYSVIGRDTKLLEGDSPVPKFCTPCLLRLIQHPRKADGTNPFTSQSKSRMVRAIYLPLKFARMFWNIP